MLNVGDSIKSIFAGNGNRLIPLSSCEPTLTDQLRFDRLVNTHKRGGLKAVMADEDLYDWAKENFNEDPGCFELRLWLLVNKKIQ